MSAERMTTGVHRYHLELLLCAQVLTSERTSSLSNDHREFDRVIGMFSYVRIVTFFTLRRDGTKTFTAATIQRATTLLG